MTKAADRETSCHTMGWFKFWFCFKDFFVFLMWIIFKVLMEFVTLLLLLYIVFFLAMRQMGS